MNNFRDIETFNTHNLGETEVLELNTGREIVINHLTQIIDNNLNSDTNIQHFALIGPRGIGKSFLLRYFQIVLMKQNADDKTIKIDYVLFPEEQKNINKPSEFVGEIVNYLSDDKVVGNRNYFLEETTEQWEESVSLLQRTITQRKGKFKKYLLIVAVENLDILLKNVFKSKVDESKFRKLLNETKDFMILGASIKSDIDTDYNKRLFKAFEKYEIEPWHDDNFIEYFNKRYALIEKQYPEKVKDIDTKEIKNKLKAIGQFSGGGPRIAIVLTNLLFKRGLLNTAQTLNQILEALTPYYMAILDTEHMPQKSMILLDTLIRNGENISQSKLAELLSAKQSDISHAFKWLEKNNLIRSQKIKGQKELLYSVADRMLSLLYHTRYLQQDVSDNPLNIYSDFLMSFYQEEEIKKQAIDCFKNNQEREGKIIEDFISNMPNKNTTSESKEDSITIQYDKAIEAIKNFNKFDDVMSGQDFAQLLDSNLVLNKIEKLLVLEKFIYQGGSKTQWTETTKVLVILNADVDENGIENSYYRKLAKFRRVQPQAILDIGDKLTIDIDNDNDEKIQKVIETLEIINNEFPNNPYLNLLVLSTHFQISMFYYKNSKFNDSIVYCKRTIKLGQKIKDKFYEVATLELIALNYKNLKQFETAINYHQKAIKSNKVHKNKSFEVSNLGGIIENYLYFNPTKAWKVFNKAKEDGIDSNALIRVMTDAIVFSERCYGRSKGFKMALDILNKLNTLLNSDEIYEAIKSIFVRLLGMKISYELLLDIASEVRNKYTEKEDFMIDGAIKCMEYQQSEDKIQFLKTLHPDLAILVKSLVKQL
jgi:DNA-binding transcriptional regulator GbsR (MarR family)